jgi:hypothetical protein
MIFLFLLVSSVAMASDVATNTCNAWNRMNSPKYSFESDGLIGYNYHGCDPWVASMTIADLRVRATGTEIMRCSYSPSYIKIMNSDSLDFMVTINLKNGKVEFGKGYKPNKAARNSGKLFTELSTSHVRSVEEGNDSKDPNVHIGSNDVYFIGILPTATST